jgi:hypothetical protein
MLKTALLALNTKTNKWEASYAGRVIVSSGNKKYVGDVITKGLNGTARDLGVTAVEEIGVVQNAHHQEPLVSFDINERFQFLEDYVDMVSDRDRASVIVVGEGGLGKSYTVMNRIRKNGLKDVDKSEIGLVISEAAQRSSFKVVKGYSSPKGLFRTLYENRNRLVIFDDCDSILKNDDAVNILKAALDSYDERIVTWNAESFGESDLPKSFEFTGAVIFISNMSMRKIPQAIISRSAPADVSMTRSEIITRMRQIVSDGDFMPDVPMEIKTEALDFIASHINNPQVKTMNLRTLIGVVTNRRCKPGSWERLSLSEMMAAC